MRVRWNALDVRACNEVGFCKGFCTTENKKNFSVFIVVDDEYVGEINREMFDKDEDMEAWAVKTTEEIVKSGYVDFYKLKDYIELY